MCNSNKLIQLDYLRGVMNRRIINNFIKRKLSSNQVDYLRGIRNKLSSIGSTLGIIPEEKHFRLVVDVSHCNLKCAMCPRGGVNALENPDKGTMSFRLFQDIVQKFVKENVKISTFEIGNWGEPLLNHELPNIIQYAKSKPGFMLTRGTAYVNTNLNYLPCPSKLLLSGIDKINISNSGMSQNIYSKNHRGGNFQKLIHNIKNLVRIRSENGLKNKVELVMVFHDYIYNKEDANIAKRFCDKNGINFTLRRPYLCSVGDSVKFHENFGEMSSFYSSFIDINKTMCLMRKIDYTQIKHCELLKRRVTVNFDGQLYRCCGVYEKRHFMGSIFEYELKQIPKIESDICKLCASTPIDWR